MRRAILALLAALVLVPLRPPAAGAQSGTPLRIAVIPTDAGMGAYYARDLGLFAKAGVNATVDSMPSGAAITAGIVAGSIDIGFSNLLPIAQANARGIPVVVVFPGSLRTADRPNGALMVTKDSPITTARDLNGKTIGVPQLQNMTQLAPMAWVDQNGGDSKTLRWAEIGLPLLGHALDERRVDAIIATEPFLTQDRVNDRELADPFNAIGTRFVGNCWFATRAFADAHPDAIAKFVTAIREAARWANAHPNDTLPIVAKYTKTPIDVLERMPHILIEENMVPADFQPLLDAAAKYGMLSHPVKAEDIIFRPPGAK